MQGLVKASSAPQRVNFVQPQPALSALLPALSLRDAVPAPTPSLSKFIVGCDYGTTFSGLAVALSGQKNHDQLLTITRWPNGGVGSTYGGNEHLVKVPSRIAYLEENVGKRNFPANRNAWGYEVLPGHVSYSWTKLLLGRDDLSDPTFDDPALKEEQDSVGSGVLTLPDGKSRLTVVSGYLACLYEQCMKELARHFKQSVLDVTPIEFWFSYPAIWTARAQALTKKAARKAGFASRPGDQIFLVPEPEAAAIYALRSSENLIPSVELNTGVLVCDCGGGTVDLTTYTVRSLKPRVRLEESVVGEGGRCGSTSLDRGLHALLRQRFGDAFNNLPKEKVSPGSKLMLDFEDIKRSFSGDEQDRVYELGLQMPELKTETVLESEYNFEDREVLLSSNDVKSLYDPVISKILGLIEKQLIEVEARGKPQVRTIVLVGGFGSSLYLWNRLQAWCRQHHGDTLDVITTKSSPWAAIARGAALRGLDGNLVEKRICRWHYGTCFARPFRPGDDDITLDKTYLNPFTGELMVQGYMEWHFSKGQTICEGDSKEIHWTECIAPKRKKSDKSKLGTVEIYYCALTNPPEKRTNNVKRIGQVKLKLDSIDYSKWPHKIERVNQSETYDVYDVDLTCQITLGSVDGTMQFTVKSDGKVCGEAQLKVKMD